MKPLPFYDLKKFLGRFVNTCPDPQNIFDRSSFCFSSANLFCNHAWLFARVEQLYINIKIDRQIGRQIDK
jgi:hypothetical protein